MNIKLNMNNMNIKSYLKLQLKVQLHLNTPKITSYVYKKGQWASYFRKSLSSIRTVPVKQNQNEKNCPIWKNTSSNISSQC